MCPHVFQSPDLLVCPARGGIEYGPGCLLPRLELSLRVHYINQHRYDIAINDCLLAGEGGRGEGGRGEGGERGEGREKRGREGRGREGGAYTLHTYVRIICNEDMDRGREEGEREGG